MTGSGSQTAPLQQLAQKGQDWAVTSGIPHSRPRFRISTGQRKSHVLPGMPPAVSLPPASPHERLAPGHTCSLPSLRPPPLPACESLPSAGDGGRIPCCSESERRASALVRVASVAFPSSRSYLSASFATSQPRVVVPHSSGPGPGSPHLTGGVPCSVQRPELRHRPAQRSSQQKDKMSTSPESNVCILKRASK